jgi:hypothetical protein
MSLLPGEALIWYSPTAGKNGVGVLEVCDAWTAVGDAEDLHEIGLRTYTVDTEAIAR